MEKENKKVEGQIKNDLEIEDKKEENKDFEELKKGFEESEKLKAKLLADNASMKKEIKDLRNLLVNKIEEIEDFDITREII